MPAAPSFQFYPDDFLAGTVTMSNEGKGAYITLLCLQWNQGHVTEDDIQSVCGEMAQPLANHVLSKFKDMGNGKKKNVKLEQVRKRQLDFRVNRSESGRRGAMKRWLSHSTAIVLPLANDSSSSPSPLDVHTPHGREGLGNSEESSNDVVPPHGWPRCEKEVEKLRGHVPFDVALKSWLIARGRGWRDAKDVPIRTSFSKWIEIANAFERERQEKDKMHGNNRRNSGSSRGDGGARVNNAKGASQYRGVGKVGGV